MNRLFTGLAAAACLFLLSSESNAQYYGHHSHRHHHHVQRSCVSPSVYSSPYIYRSTRAVYPSTTRHIYTAPHHLHSGYPRSLPSSRYPYSSSRVYYGSPYSNPYYSGYNRSGFSIRIGF